MIRKLTNEEIRFVVMNYLPQHFDPDEVKQYQHVKPVIEKGRYFGYCIDENGIQAYALVMSIPERRIALLDYLAVLPDMRGKGLGTELLKSFFENESERFDRLYIEIEHPDEYKWDDREHLLQRKHFYVRSGVKECGVNGLVFGVPFQILCLEKNGISPVNSETHLENYDFIYSDMLSKTLYDKNVFVRIAE